MTGEEEEEDKVLILAEQRKEFVEEWFSRMVYEFIPWEKILVYDPTRKSSEIVQTRRLEFRKGIRKTFEDMAACKDERTLSMKASTVLCLLHVSEPVGPKEYYRSVMGWAGPRMYLRSEFVPGDSKMEFDAFMESTAFDLERMAFHMRSWEEPDPSNPTEVDSIRRNADTFLARVRTMLGSGGGGGGIETWYRTMKQQRTT